MMETEIQGTGNNKIKSILKEILIISIYLLLVFCAAYLIVTYVGPVSYTHLTLPTNSLV